MSQGLPETATTYWYWGLPSLVLAAVTLISVFLSVFWMDPAIPAKYESLLRKGSRSEFNDGTREATEDQRTLDQLRLAELAAQRLIVHYPREARYRLEAAKVELAIAEVAENTALRYRLAAERSKEREFEQRSSFAQTRAQEYMQGAARLSGPEAATSELWLLGNRLFQSRQRADDLAGELELASAVALGIQNQGDNRENIQPLLGEIEIRTGHRTGPAMKLEQRRSAIERGVEHFDTLVKRQKPLPVDTEYGGIVGMAWLAEGLAGIAPAESVSIARDAIVTYAAEMDPGKIKGTIRSQVERIDALFRCLVLVSGVEEASIAVLGRLEQFSQSERDLLQNIAVASHFRMLQSSISFPEGAFAKAGSLNILRSAMRMRPTHPEVTALLDAFYSSNPNNDLATSIVHVMGSDKDRLMRVLYWTKGVIDAKEDHESATIQWSNDDTDILVGLATHWVHKSPMEVKNWVVLDGILEQWCGAVPECYELRFARGVFAARNGNSGLARELVGQLRGERPGDIVLERLERLLWGAR